MFKKFSALNLFLLGALSPLARAPIVLKQVPINHSKIKVTVPLDIKQSLYHIVSQLTADYFKASEQPNQIFSPLSLWYALGVLREGASGDTLEELNQLMNLSAAFDSSKVVPHLSASLNFMEESIMTVEQEENGILLSNGLFFDQAYVNNLRKIYWKKAATIWNTETAAVDFTKKLRTEEIIRHWVSEKTNHFIEDYKATFDSSGTAILNIYNVLYLKDHWQKPFNPLGDQVYNSPGGEVLVPYMGKVIEDAHYFDHEKAQVVAFPSEKGIKAWFLLPKDQLKPIDLISHLDELLQDGDVSSVNFQAPTLDIEGDNISLKDLLQGKGYSKLFHEAQLDGMVQGLKVAVSEIKQKTKLQMDELGFKAAAITEIGIAMRSMPTRDPISFLIHKPYLLVIEYQSLPLFIAQVTNPARDEDQV